MLLADRRDTVETSWKSGSDLWLLIFSAAVEGEKFDCCSAALETVTHSYVLLSPRTFVSIGLIFRANKT